ncbi:NAD-dependent succinate-semialdehyde dehydrogenase [Marinomonas rhizomae]|uniref:Succinate-semialdehyde dehydrogenase/glutarate-semialdehyde dehydrogenase n=1 Tax=Marinomonas rhizomae TaxID=491948 RepID=A0A366IX31_9GAMM|nr:NAD-dependent succinate-semialdehyde dehydrogenase [Marinomonas rhizomae]RBP79127.1 succinate-semialdehyde dehydrogenase/glutarate-semialdehyde dehydrogenase [Marinomonas rhizomae]RNF70418.1 NAD-dependent succinate-semialdehyde dehydrogenase [Marinomonas rhizomae]
MLEQKLNDPSLLKQAGFINGQWVNAKDGKTFEVFNPAVGEVIANVADLGTKETLQAIEAAQVAFDDWKVVPAKQRSSLLRRWFELVLDHQEDLAVIMTFEQGKVIAESRGEIAYGASYIEWFAEEAKRIYGDVLPSTSADRRSLVIKQPVGVVGAITPWNFPNAMITRKVAPALAAGCTIVLKPAAETPLSALALAELGRRAGIPAGVFNVVVGTDAKAIGAELTSSSIVKKITFTGSTAVGKLLMEQSAKTVKKTSMELGGNAPVLIFEDADLDKAVEGALVAKFRNAGQTCICANRILVQDSIYEEFISRFTARVSEFVLGDGVSSTSTMGPLISRKAVAGVTSLVDDAVSQGAKICIGGSASNNGDHFFQPTVLRDLNTSMRLAKEEVFGPVAPVFMFSSEKEAVDMANDTEFGLAAYMYTKDHSRIWRVGEALEYGMVGINETAISSEMIPFGGVKESGQGREGSKYGLEDYLEVKYFCLGDI